MEFCKSAWRDGIYTCFAIVLFCSVLAGTLFINEAGANQVAPPPLSVSLSSLSTTGAVSVISAIRDQLGLAETVSDISDNSSRESSSNTPAALSVTQALENMVLSKSTETPHPQTEPETKKSTGQAPAPSQAEALKIFYGHPDRKPIWISKTGLSKQALAVVAKFQQADTYGLRPQDFTLPQAVQEAINKENSSRSPAQLAKIEISLSKNALKYVRYARGGRIDPKSLSRFQDRGATLPDPLKTLTMMAATKTPETTLLSYHPQHPEFKALRQKLQTISSKPVAGNSESKSSKTVFPANGPTLRLGMKHAQIADLRKRLGHKKGDDLEFDQALHDGVVKFQRRKGLGADGVVGAGTRRALAGLATKKPSSEKLRARILINMERWRWMPEKMQGDNNIFVWANVPELRVRIIRKGKQVFTERVIAGKLGKQSPMFSDKMEWIEFNPTWFIPNSIKVADILPSLRGKGRVMSKYHLRLDCGKHGNDFTKIDWKKVDIRKCAVTQPTGAKSVLGKFKFKFPNKHAVYMHDTLTPNLFNRKHRILSHGCIRIRDPRRMAEILLANDKGMTPNRIGSFLANRGLHTEHLRKAIPVHITYFSTRVTDKGGLTHHPDYYGHDKRLARALLGKGHLFKGAIYSGRKPYKRKPRKRRVSSEIPSVNPAFFPQQ